jgi:hypothetical protein
VWLRRFPELALSPPKKNNERLRRGSRKSVFKLSQIQPYHTPRIALEHVPQTATRTDYRVVEPVRIVHFKAAKRKAAILNPHGVSAGGR